MFSRGTNSVLVIAPGRKTRGGITSVVNEYEKATFWNHYSCRWIESYIDKSAFHKAGFFIRSYLIFLCLLPSCKLVHIHLSERTSLRRKAFFFWPAVWFGKKTVLHFHGFSPDTTIKGPSKKLYRKLFSRADAVILLSEFWDREISAAIGDNIKSSVIFNPFSADNRGMNMKRNRNERKPYILYAGTLNKRKGFRDLIRAFAAMEAEHPEWELILAGNGEMEEGKKLAISLGIGEKVQFIGWVEGAEKARLFQEGSIFCLPSYAEGFPMSVIEAWSYGLPVVTTPVGGLGDVLVHRHNAMVFQPGDIQALTVHLSELISDETLWSGLMNEALLVSGTLFGIDTISREVSDLYDNLMEE